MTTSRTRSPSTLTVININIWQKNTNQKRKNTKLENVSNATKRGTSPRTVKKHS